MSWEVEFYNTDVYDGFMQWPESIKARLIKIVEMIKQFGANLGMPHTRTIGDGLFEIRAKGKEGVGRAFFCYIKNQKIVILHGFVKKTEKTPRKELKLAKLRMKEVINHEL